MGELLTYGRARRQWVGCLTSWALFDVVNATTNPGANVQSSSLRSRLTLSRRWRTSCRRDAGCGRRWYPRRRRHRRVATSTVRRQRRGSACIQRWIRCLNESQSNATSTSWSLLQRQTTGRVVQPASVVFHAPASSTTSPTHTIRPRTNYTHYVHCTVRSRPSSVCRGSGIQLTIRGKWPNPPLAYTTFTKVLTAGRLGSPNELN